MNEPKPQPRRMVCATSRSPNAKPACELDCLDTPVLYALLIVMLSWRKLSPESGTNYLMNRISWKVGSGQRSSATMPSSESPASRTLSIAGSTSLQKCLASASTPSPP